MERTLAIIKPDATKKRTIGKIVTRIEEEGFTIVRMKLAHLTKDEAKGFYIVHKDKGFYDSLCEFMSSGPVVLMVARGRERHQALAQGHGRHRPGPGRARNAPPPPRLLHRAQRRPRLRRPGHRGVGDRLLLQEIALPGARRPRGDQRRTIDGSGTMAEPFQ